MTTCAQAGPGRGTATGESDRWSQSYHQPQPMSRPKSESETSSALGALMIYLLGSDLPTEERRLGWALAKKWTGQLVDAKHNLLVGAA